MVLLPLGLEQLALGEKGLVGLLLLVLKLEPVHSFMEFHGMLQDHDYKHLLGSRVRQIALVDEGSNAGV